MPFDPQAGTQIGQADMQRRAALHRKQAIGQMQQPGFQPQQRPMMAGPGGGQMPMPINFQQMQNDPRQMARFQALMAAMAGRQAGGQMGMGQAMGQMQQPRY